MRDRLPFLSASVLTVLLSTAPAFAAGGETQSGSTQSSATETPAEASGDSQSPSAPGLPLSGRVFSDIYIPIRDLDTSTFRQSSASLWLQGDPRLGENGFARFILTADALEARNTETGSTSSLFRTGLREGYAGYASHGWEFRLGRQILPWGKSDAINPTDFLSARDFTFFNPDTEVQRVGATSLWLNWTPAEGNSPLTFTVVATPAFAQSRLLIPQTLLPPGITFNSTPLTPAQTLGNTETATKVAYNGSGWDASLSAFRGFNHVPEFAITSSTPGAVAGAPPVAFQIGQVFHHIRALGADGSVSSGKWVYRAETSYIWTENDHGLDPTIQPSHWDSVIGVERPLGEDFRIQGQVVYRYIPGFTPASAAGGPDPITAQVNQGIAQSNALLLAYQEKSRPGATLRIAYANETKGIDAEIFILGNFVGGDYLLRPKASYNWTDALKTSVGVDYYGGPEDRPLGVLKVFNSLFLEAKYTF